MSVLTKNCDFYFAIHENGINRMINRAMRYLPSFFNYTDETGIPARDWTVQNFNPRVACVPVDPDPSVGSWVYSVIKIPPLQLPMNLQLPQIDNTQFIMVAQLPQLKVDFYPGNAITLPSTLPHPLPAQTLAIQAMLDAGISCPSTGDLGCFSLGMFAELALKKPNSTQFLDVNICSLDVAGLQPDGLRKTLDCYAVYLTNQILASASNTINALLSSPLPVPMQGITNLKVSPASVSNNPAIENDQLKVFMNLSSISVNYAVTPSGTSQPGSGYGAPISKAKRIRPGTGPSDLTVAISQDAIDKIFAAVLNRGPANPGISVQLNGRYGTPPTNGQGGVYFDYDVGASLNGGSVNLQNNGTLQILDVGISWDKLKFTVNIDLPGIKFTIPIINKDVQLFGGNGNHPDISIPIDLSGDLQSQVSLVVKPTVLYATGNPNILNSPNRWQLYMVPQLPIFVVPLELNQKLVDAIEAGVKKAIDDVFSVFGDLKGAAEDVAEVALAALTLTIDPLLGAALIAALSDPSKIAEQIVDTITNANEFGLTTKLDNLLYYYFTNQAPIFELRDPLIGPNATSQNWGTNPLGPWATPPNSNPIGPALINLPIPLAYLGLTINSHEMVLEMDIGP